MTEWDGDTGKIRSAFSKIKKRLKTRVHISKPQGVSKFVPDLMIANRNVFVLFSKFSTPNSVWEFPQQTLLS